MKKNIVYLFMICTMTITLASCSKEPTYINEKIEIKTSDEALARLKEGNMRFVQDQSQLININSAKRLELEDGQHPYAIVISCSDSRVDPSHLFNAGLGELFEIRLAGNVIDVDVLGTLEYGVEHLGSPLIVVMGHEDCGAVTAEYNRIKNHEEIGGHIDDLIDQIEPSVLSSSSVDEAIQKHVDYVLGEIKKDEHIQKLVESGEVKVVGAYYHLDGTVEFK